MASTVSTGTPVRYGRVAIALHWLIATLIAVGFSIGWVMTRIAGFTPAKLKYFSWHKWIGVTVLAFALVRLLWRIAHRAPPLPAAMAGWQRQAAHAVHLLLYALMLAVPASGYLYSSAAGIQVVYLGILPLPAFIGPDPALKPVLREVHVLLDYTLAALVGAHLLAALKHQFIDRDGLLARMLPFLR
jgi:cytochrome b561